MPRTMEDCLAIMRKDGARQALDAFRQGFRDATLDNVLSLVNFDMIDRLCYPVVLMIEQYRECAVAWASAYIDTMREEAEA